MILPYFSISCVSSLSCIDTNTLTYSAATKIKIRIRHWYGDEGGGVGWSGGGNQATGHLKVFGVMPLARETLSQKSSSRMTLLAMVHLKRYMHRMAMSVLYACHTELSLFHNLKINTKTDNVLHF